MRSWIVLVSAVVIPVAGCNAVYLRNRTLDQVATVTDLRYQQVLDNIAQTAADPGAMPYFAILEKGTTQVEDQANPNGSLTWDPYGLTLEMLGMSATRALTGEWDVSPVTDPDKLHAMRCVYHWVSNPADSGDECAETLRFFKVGHELKRVTPGWFSVGRKCDVPKGACYVAHCGGTYVWVNPGGLDSFTWVTMAIMDIATVDKTTLAKVHHTQTVQEYEYVKGTNNISKIITYTEPRKEGAAGEFPAPSKVREPRTPFLPGLAVTPALPPR
jgi:hypothetical protein